MFCMIKKKKMYPAYVSKYNSNREKEFILLMVPNEKGWGAKFEGQWNHLESLKE